MSDFQKYRIFLTDYFKGQFGGFKRNDPRLRTKLFYSFSWFDESLLLSKNSQSGKNSNKNIDRIEKLHSSVGIRVYKLYLRGPDTTNLRDSNKIASEEYNIYIGVFSRLGLLLPLCFCVNSRANISNGQLLRHIRKTKEELEFYSQ
ncbi:hypothetical protein HOG48_06630 [Candidatus Peregrinibacteria bacterium]|jgi:hypothetical protein|nr:hypothetical protein [Candidatus Peregrinibacteria bacterium]